MSGKRTKWLKSLCWRHYGGGFRTPVPFREGVVGGKGESPKMSIWKAVKRMYLKDPERFFEVMRLELSNQFDLARQRMPTLKEMKEF